MPQPSATGHLLHFVSLGASANPSSPRAASKIQRPAPPAARAPAPAPKPANDRRSFRAGVNHERRRWSEVIGSKAFRFNPKLAAHLLAESSQSASQIIALLRQQRVAAVAAAEARKAAIDEGWQRAFARARAPGAA